MTAQRGVELTRLAEMVLQALERKESWKPAKGEDPPTQAPEADAFGGISVGGAKNIPEKHEQSRTVDQTADVPVRQTSGDIVVIADSGKVVKNTSQDQLVDVLTLEAEDETLDSPVPQFMEGSVGVVKDIRQEQTDEETLSVQQLEIMELLSAAAEAREAAREEVAKQTLAAETAHIGVMALGEVLADLSAEALLKGEEEESDAQSATGRACQEEGQAQEALIAVRGGLRSVGTLTSRWSPTLKGAVAERARARVQVNIKKLSSDERAQF